MVADNTPNVSTDTDPVEGDAPTVRDEIADFVAGLTPLVARLTGVLQGIAPLQVRRHATVGPKQMQVIPMASAMIRTTPDLSGVTADRLDGIMEDAAACGGLSRQLNMLVATLDSTGRLRTDEGWHVTSGAIATARKLAPLNGKVMSDVADIDEVLARGPRDLQAAHMVVTVQAQAAKATERATRANEKLAAAKERSAALQRGTGAATGTEAAGTAATEPAGGTTPSR